MLVTKLVVRLLDPGGMLLGWAEVQGQARGDGCLWVEEQTIIQLEHDGTVAFLSIHWCDVNVELRSEVERAQVKFGEVMTLPGDWEAMRVGPAAGGLPPVTVRQSVSIGIPVGNFGLMGHT